MTAAADKALPPPVKIVDRLTSVVGLTMVRDPGDGDPTWIAVQNAVGERCFILGFDAEGAMPAEGRDVDQRTILAWARSTFGETACNIDERAARLVEEAIEAAQAVDLPEAVIDRIKTRVYSRPKGGVAREIGGVMLTALAFAERMGVDAMDAARWEYTRVLGIPRSVFARKHRDKVEAGTADLSPPGADHG